MLDGVAEAIPDSVSDAGGIGHVEERPEHVRDIAKGSGSNPPPPASGPARKRAPITNRAKKTANAAAPEVRLHEMRIATVLRFGIEARKGFSSGETPAKSRR
jgi:hypothetical protein